MSCRQSVLSLILWHLPMSVGIRCPWSNVTRFFSSGGCPKSNLDSWHNYTQHSSLLPLAWFHVSDPKTLLQGSLTHVKLDLDGIVMHQCNENHSKNSLFVFVQQQKSGSLAGKSAMDSHPTHLKLGGIFISQNYVSFKPPSRPKVSWLFRDVECFKVLMNGFCLSVKDVLDILAS